MAFRANRSALSVVNVPDVTRNRQTNMGKKGNHWWRVVEPSTLTRGSNTEVVCNTCVVISVMWLFVRIVLHFQS